MGCDRYELLEALLAEGRAARESIALGNDMLTKIIAFRFARLVEEYDAAVAKQEKDNAANTTRNEPSGIAAGGAAV